MGFHGLNFDCIRKWCMNKIINVLVVVAFLIFVIIIIFAASIGSNSPSIIASTSSVLSTKKIGWGIKRSDNHRFAYRKQLTPICAKSVKGAALYKAFYRPAVHIFPIQTFAEIIE